MANRKRAIPQYGTVTLNGLDYYRTRVQDADGKLRALYARTPEELYDKELNALEQIDNDTFCRKSPTVAEYCEKWLLMQSVHVRASRRIIIMRTTDYAEQVSKNRVALSSPIIRAYISLCWNCQNCIYDCRGVSSRLRRIDANHIRGLCAYAVFFLNSRNRKGEST